MRNVTLLVNFWSKLYSKGGSKLGAPFKVPSYLVHPLVVPSIRFRTLVSNAYYTPSLRSVAGGMLPCFAQSLGGRFLASLSHFPFNGSIKFLQNLHSRGSIKQHFYVWEPCCGYLLKVKKKVSWCPLIEEGHRLAIILENVLVPS